jgi:hypothetical protein
MAASLAFRLSGGAGNAAPLASTGGVMSTTAATANTLFDTVSAAEASAGDTEYRAIFLLNDGDKDLTGLKLWMSDQAASGVLALALDGVGKNADAEVEADESTAPTGETFSSPTDVGSAISVPDLAVGDRHAIWVRRVISAATGGVALASNAAELRVDYEYVP